MSNIDNILATLDKVKSLGGGKYRACCPAHNDKTPSLNIKDLEDGRIIMHCFGCGANGIEIIKAMGLDPGDLFPDPLPGDQHGYKRNRNAYPATQKLKSLQFETSIVLLAAYKILKDGALNTVDVKRLEESYKLISEAVTYANK